MPPLNQDHGYWRSLRELEQDVLADDGDFDGAPHEFPASAIDQQTADPLSRRSFVRVMGASMALAGVAGAGCKRYDKDEIVPLARRPEDQTPGIPQQFATAWDFNGHGHALLATSYEGRPIKLDGNPEHPFAGGGAVEGTKSHGGSSALAQASILSLYDPDRSRSVLQNGAGANFGDFVGWLQQQMKPMKDSPVRVRVLSEASSSPTVARLKQQLVQERGGTVWYEWEPVSGDNVRAGTKIAFGRAMRPLVDLSTSKTIVALDCDLFVEHPAAMQLSRDWSRSRRFGRSSLGQGAMSRLYAIESSFTSTGAVADHRLPLRSELVLPFVMALDQKLSGTGEATAAFLTDDKVKPFLDVLAEELQDNAGSVVLVAGHRQPPVVHALVAKINQHLRGKVQYVVEPEQDRFTHGEAIARLTKDLEQNQVDYLFIIGGNPVYDAPGDVGFAAALANAKGGVVHLSEYQDETSKKAMWHLPRAHFLEAWGDARTYDGTYTLAQPLIMPMFGGISTIELLTLILGGDAAAGITEPDGMKSVRATFDELRPGIAWNTALERGFVPGSAFAADPTAQVGPIPPESLTDRQKGGIWPGDAMELVFVPSTQTWDGRFANNAWLQETPDFMSKVTWDNYALVGPTTAKVLEVETDAMIKLEVGGRSVDLPVYVMPGQAPGSIAVVLGGGRTAAGRTGGDGRVKVGFDVNPLRSAAALDIVTEGVKVSRTGGKYELASTQEHWNIRRGIKKDVAQWGIGKRLDDLVREATLDEANDAKWRAEPDHHWPLVSLYKERDYPETRVHAWGMTIDMSSCTGCNACAVACQAENNVPVVGKANVIRNREMGWIRIDRYFSGNEENPEIVHQPLACVHCENAPCEQVCPVGATLHSSEGLNDMTYNRCIGTRYCLNNCPYKVRRFNFFDYQKEWKEARNKVRRLLFNPEVTVRHRGVMEKCTYCVQRIQNKKIEAKNQRVELEDGAIVTACQAACPTEAIVFGDLNDPNSRVRRLQELDRRSYEMLNGELNTKPRTHYLARVRNPNPKLVTGHGNRGTH